MDKDEILKISQQENKGKLDERESLAYGKASRLGMAVGALLCMILVLISEFFLNAPELAMSAWLVYFTMQGSFNLSLYSRLKTRSKLIYAIAELIFACAFAVALVIKTVA